MAKKRALVDAALTAGRLSHVLTQDMEEENHQAYGADRNRPAPRERSQSAGNRNNRQDRGNGTADSDKRCPEHGRAWAITPNSQMGHPLENGNWCYRDEGSAATSETRETPSLDEILEDEIPPENENGDQP